MRKTILYLLLLFSYLATAQVTFTAQAPKKVAQNQRFQLAFTINAQADGFRPPKIQGFRAQGPFSSTSSTWSNTGGSSFKKSFIYTMTPIKQGTFTIPPATITYRGKVYKTKPLKIVVGKPVKRQARQQRQQQQYDPFANDPFFQDPFAILRNKHRPGTRQQPKPQTAEEKAALLKHAKEEIFIAANITNKNPYLNEAVTVTYRLYVSKASVTNYEIKEMPEFDGFWAQELKGQYRVQETEIDGKPYRYITLQKQLLFPQKLGKLTIEPLAVKMVVEIPTKQYDIFGRPRMRQEVITKTSARKIIQVKSLPEAAKPIDFSGAVGQFDFRAQLNKNQLKTGDSAELILQVQGTGNLKLFSFPKLNMPSELEVYDPEHHENTKATTVGLKGYVSEKYVLVPEYGGKFPLQNISFSYFDPKQEKYIRKEAANLVLNVIGDQKKTAAVVAVVNAKEVVFNDIKTTLSTVAPTKALFFKSKVFWILLLTPFGIIPFLLLFKRRRDAYLNDTEGIKTRKASRLVKKYLSTARKNKNNKEAFYEALEKAYHNFLKAKLKIETSDFSQDKIAAILQEKGVEQDVIARFIASLQSCDMARYSPFTSSDIAKEYDNAAALITQLNKVL